VQSTQLAFTVVQNGRGEQDMQDYPFA